MDTKIGLIDNMDDKKLRVLAEKSLKKKQDFWRYIGVYIGVNALLVGIWWISSPAGYFWPAWPMLGMAVAIPIIGFEAYGPGASGPSEEKLQAEMRRLSGN